MHQPVVVRQERGESAYFTIYWSPLRKADKYDIVRSVPSVGGVYELYYMDERKKLNLAFFAHAWYGGLRSSLRKLVDIELQSDPKVRGILENYDVYFRYSCTDSNMDMLDVVFFFDSVNFPDGRHREDSGRFETIYVNEISADKIVTI